jgi:hypothetical protein
VVEVVHIDGAAIFNRITIACGGRSTTHRGDNTLRTHYIRDGSGSTLEEVQVLRKLIQQAFGECRAFHAQAQGSNSNP